MCFLFCAVFFVLCGFCGVKFFLFQNSTNDVFCIGLFATCRTQQTKLASQMGVCRMRFVVIVVQLSHIVSVCVCEVFI